MKQFPILQGHARVVELPEGATNPEVHTRSLTFDTPMEVDEWGYDYQAIKLPPGTWQIVGLLPEVTEEDLSEIVSFIQIDKRVGWYDYNSPNPLTFPHATALESLESAIVASGYYLYENTFGKVPGCGCTGPSDKGACDGCDDWMDTQSRVLCRERCLILRRKYA